MKPTNPLPQPTVGDQTCEGCGETIVLVGTEWKRLGREDKTSYCRAGFSLPHPHRPKSPTPIPVGEQAHKSEHWMNPETGYAECVCCCSWALDTERLVKALRSIRDQSTPSTSGFAAEVHEMQKIAKEALEAFHVKN